jgi:hypothetical protein
LTETAAEKFPDPLRGPTRSVCVVRAACALALCALLVVPACRDAPSAGQTEPGNTSSDVFLRPVPKWMEGYCHRAADDLGFPVLCPRRMPRLIDIVPCKGPAPREELWGKYCYDYVLDALFRGPPGYRGPFGGTAGHLAIWTIGPGSDFHPGEGLFACPGGGLREESERVGGHEGSWWRCPHTTAANVNSGHIAFQWRSDDVVYGLSVHGLTGESRRIVRVLAGQLQLVGPAGAV